MHSAGAGADYASVLFRVAPLRGVRRWCAHRWVGVHGEWRGQGITLLASGCAGVEDGFGLGLAEVVERREEEAGGVAAGLRFLGVSVSRTCASGTPSAARVTDTDTEDLSWSMAALALDSRSLKLFFCASCKHGGPVASLSVEGGA
jgi:hypothetical protein